MKDQTLSDYIARAERHENRKPGRERCHCFPGTCRGGEVINGLLANGLRCKACVPAPIKTPV